MIRLENLLVSYNQGEALRIEKMEFSSGSFTTVLGKNGSGKSTFLRTLAGILSYEGRIEIAGDELSGLKFSDKAKIAGYLPQRLVPADMTVSMLVAHGRFPWKSFPRKLSKRDIIIIRDAMEQVGILPLKDKNLKEISGGELKLSYLAMLIAQDTKVLLLDEPDAHLDIEHQRLLYQILREIASSGRTVIQTSHDLVKSMNYSDYIYILKKGKKVLEGTPSEISDKKEELNEVMSTCVIETDQKESLYKYIYSAMEES